MLDRLAEYLDAHDVPPIRMAVDIGCNRGDVARAILETFPDCLIRCYELLPELCDQAKEKLKEHEGRYTVSNKAITAQHQYLDDIGTVPRPPILQNLRIWEQTPVPKGCYGGHQIASKKPGEGYTERSDLVVPAATLDDITTDDVDLMKTDCEGSERSFLGTASVGALLHYRWIVGEYHNAARFYTAVGKLRTTHRLLMRPTRAQTHGIFLAERKNETPGLLKVSPEYEAINPKISKRLTVTLHALQKS